MPVFWLRTAVAIYGFGVLYAMVALARKREVLTARVMPVLMVGLVLHAVSIVEAQHFLVTSIPAAESLLGCILMAFFAGIYVRYKTTSPGVFVLPAVFLLSLSAAMAQQPPTFTSQALRSGWIFFHIVLIFLGYAALFLSLAASLLYLIQERKLKQKKAGGIFGRLPALQTIDDLGYRSLVLGFPFMTIGLITGSVLAQEQFGAGFFRDPKVVLSILMWIAYSVMLYTRWTAGWRGKRAAYLSGVTFAAALTAWVANSVSFVHGFMRQ